MAFSWHTWSWILLVIDAAILAVAFAVLRWRLGSAFFTWSKLFSAAVWTVFLWALVGLAVGGIVGFCLISRALWTLATVALPAVLIGLWIQRRKSVLLAGAALCLLLKFYGEAVEPRRLEIETVRIPLAGLKGPVRIVHLSDLQTDSFGPLQTRVQEAANAYDPHFVVFTGDLINHDSLRGDAVQWFKGFRRRSEAFLVGGNVDDPALLPQFCSDTGWTCLDDEARLAKAGNDLIGFAGRSLAGSMDGLALASSLKNLQAAHARLVLAHVPDVLLLPEAQSADVLFSGHTHGGQVSTPLGPIVTLSGVPRRIAAGGLHRAGKLWVSQSRGLGWEGHVAPRVRLFARPHLLLVELVPASL